MGNKFRTHEKNAKQAGERKSAGKTENASNVATPKKNTPESSPTGKKGIDVKVSDLYEFSRKNKLLQTIVPKGFTKEQIESIIIETVQEFEKNKEKATLNKFLGRFWEKAALRDAFVRRMVGEALTRSIDMLDIFCKEHYSRTGFFDFNGDLTRLSSAELKALEGALSQLKKADLSNFDNLKKHGLVYLDGFEIGRQQYKDGAFALTIGDRLILLVNVEMKTKFSDGVIPQSATWLSRLATVSVGTPLLFNRNGKPDGLPLHSFLFNPMWFPDNIGIKESEINQVRSFEVRRSQNYVNRLISRQKALLKVSSEIRANFPVSARGTKSIGELSAKFVDIIYSETNLRGLREYFELFIETQRRNQR